MPSLNTYALAFGTLALATLATSLRSTIPATAATTEAREPRTFRYAPVPSVMITGRTRLSANPVNLGSTDAYVFTAEPSLPAGLGLNRTTGRLSGKLSAPQAGRAYSIHATNNRTGQRRTAKLYIEGAKAPESEANQFFVNGSAGNDANPGSFASPFKTIAKGVEAIRNRPGSTLNLRAGAYLVPQHAGPASTDGSIRIWNVAGTAEAPIVIRSYPGELVTIDATYPEFRAINRGQWVRPSDPQAHPDEWVSAMTFAIDSNDWVNRGFFLDRTPYTRLLSYSKLEDLRAGNETFDTLPSYSSVRNCNNIPEEAELAAPNDPENDSTCPAGGLDSRIGPYFVRSGETDNEDSEAHRQRFPWTYFGPGVFWNPETQRVHIRLSHTHNRVEGLEDYAGETNPNTVKIGVSARSMVGVTLNGNRNLVIKHLKVRGGGETSVTLSANSGLVLDHVEIHAPTVGLVVNNDMGTKVLNSLFLGGIPTWTFRSDFKSAYDPCAEVAPGDVDLAADGCPAGYNPACSPIVGTDNSLNDDCPVGQNRASNNLVRKTQQTLMLVSGQARNTEIAFSEFRDGHDVYVGGQGTDFHHNLLSNIHDEAFFLDDSPSTRDVKIHENLIRQVLSAFSFSGNQIGGMRSIYRNVVDLRDPTAGYRPRGGTSLRREISPWRYGHLMKHGSAIGPHQVFQNTILVNTRQKSQSAFNGFNSLPASLNGPFHPRSFVNNVFVQFAYPDADLAASVFPSVTQLGSLMPDGSHAFQSKGNLWDSRGSSFPLMYCVTRVKLADGSWDRCLHRTFETLSLLQTSPDYAAAGWEQGSRQGDSRFEWIEADGAGRENDSLRLRPDSPARGAGIALPPELRALDPFAPADESALPDAGAFQSGQPALEVGVDGSTIY
jgi:hypothetical protein